LGFFKMIVLLFHFDLNFKVGIGIGQIQL